MFQNKFFLSLAAILSASTLASAQSAFNDPCGPVQPQRVAGTPIIPNYPSYPGLGAINPLAPTNPCPGGGPSPRKVKEWNCEPGDNVCWRRKSPYCIEVKDNLSGNTSTICFELPKYGNHTGNPQISGGGGGGGSGGGGGDDSKFQNNDAFGISKRLGELEHWAGPSSTTLNPALVANGVKLSDDVDLTVTLPGESFELMRCFSGGSNGAFANVGRGWQLSVDARLSIETTRWDAGTSGNPDIREIQLISMHTSPSRESLMFTNADTGDANFFRQIGPGTWFVEVLPNTMTAGGKTAHAYRVTTLTEGEYYFFRAVDGDPPEIVALDGMLWLRLDKYGNPWTYRYLQEDIYDSLVFQSKLPRLESVSLHGDSPADPNTQAAVFFIWDLGFNSFPPTESGSGMLRSVQTVRFDGPANNRKGFITDVVDYTYGFDVRNAVVPTVSTADLGSLTSLVQVTKRVLVNAPTVGALAMGDAMAFFNIVQYRYHMPEDPSKEFMWPMKAVMNSDQIEYISEHLNLDDSEIYLENESAGSFPRAVAVARYLLTKQDSDTIPLSTELLPHGTIPESSSNYSLRDLFSKRMEYYGSAPIPGLKGRVKFEYLLRSLNGTAGISRLVEHHEYFQSAAPMKVFKLPNPAGGADLEYRFETTAHHVSEYDSADDNLQNSELIRKKIYRTEPFEIFRYVSQKFAAFRVAPFSTAEAVCDFEGTGTAAKCWVTLHEFDAQNRPSLTIKPSGALVKASGLPDFASGPDRTLDNVVKKAVGDPHARAEKLAYQIYVTSHAGFQRMARLEVEHRLSCNTAGNNAILRELTAYPEDPFDSRPDLPVSKRVFSGTSLGIDPPNGFSKDDQYTQFGYSFEQVKLPVNHAVTNATQFARMYRIRRQSTTQTTEADVSFKGHAAGLDASAVSWTGFYPNGTTAWTCSPNGVFSVTLRDAMTGAARVQIEDYNFDNDEGAGLAFSSTTGAALPTSLAATNGAKDRATTEGKPLKTEMVNDLSGWTKREELPDGNVREYGTEMSGSSILESFGRTDVRLVCSVREHFGDNPSAHTAYTVFNTAMKPIATTRNFQFSGSEESARTTTLYDITGKAATTRRWWALYNSDASSDPEMYYEKSSWYDICGRPSLEVNENGDVSTTEYDVNDRPIRKTRKGSAPGAATQVDVLYYDNFGTTLTQGVGDGLLTVTVHENSEAPALSRYTQTHYNDLSQPFATLQGVNFPGTLTAPTSVVIQDMIGRTVESVSVSPTAYIGSIVDTLRSHSTALSLRFTGNAALDPATVIAHQRNVHTPRGQVYLSQTAVTPGDWDEYLSTERWFDMAGREVAVRAPSSPGVLRDYDRHGRVIAEFRTAHFNASATMFENLENHPILEGTLTQYFEDKPLVSGTCTIRRGHNAGTAAGFGPNPIATYTRMGYSTTGRPVVSVNYGTNVDYGANWQGFFASQVGSTSSAWPDALWPDELPFGIRSTIEGPLNAGTPTLYNRVIAVWNEYNERGLLSKTSRRREFLFDESAINETDEVVSYTGYDALDRAVMTIDNLTGSVPTVTWAPPAGSIPGHWALSQPGNGPSEVRSAAQNRITTTVYDGLNNTILRTAHSFNGTATDSPQRTEFVYREGEQLSTGIANSASTSNLLYEIRYPDRTSGNPSTAASDIVRYAYNAYGEQKAVIDQNGTVRLFDRDNAGRMLADRVDQFGTVSGSAVDASVELIQTAYDVFGRVTKVSSHSDSPATTTNELNSVSYTYDALGSVTTLKQVAARGVSGGTSAPLDAEREIVYSFETQGAVETGTSPIVQTKNRRLLTAMKYPDATPGTTSDDTSAAYFYGEAVTEASNANFDLAMGRVTQIRLSDSGATPSETTALAAYERLGLGTVVLSNLHTLSGNANNAWIQSDRSVNYFGKRYYGTGLSTDDGSNTTTGRIYPGWDRFGRLTLLTWARGNHQAGTGALAGVTATVPAIVQKRYRYDRSGNRMIDDELRATTTTTRSDRYYVYDPLGRLIQERRGTFQVGTGQAHPGTNAITTSTGSLAPGAKQWTLDELGNWKAEAKASAANVTFDVSADRHHNRVNEYFKADAFGSSTDADYRPAVERVYDKNGNLIIEKRGPSPGSVVNWQRYVYDAWNRLTRVETWNGSAWNPFAQYQYNALNWRTLERQRYEDQDHTPASANHLNRTRLYYYSKDWQVLQVAEDDQAPDTAVLGTSGFVSRRELQFFYGARNADDLIMRRSRVKSSTTGLYGAWDGASREYVLTDANFSPVAITDGNGQVTRRVDYDAYGSPLLRSLGDLNGDGATDDGDFPAFSTSYDALECTSAAMPRGEKGNSCPADLNEDGLVDDVDFSLFVAIYNAGLTEPWLGPLYAGYWYDESVGFYQCRMRWHDPEAGRWLTRDPAGYVDGLSLYLYVRGNPNSFTDPIGLAGESSAANVIETAHNWAAQKVGNAAGAVRDAGFSGLADVGFMAAGAVKTSGEMTAGNVRALTNPSETAQAMLQEARQQDINAGLQPSAKGTALNLAANFSGMKDVATSITGHDLSTNQPVTGLDRLAAGLRGGGSAALAILSPLAPKPGVGAPAPVGPKYLLDTNAVITHGKQMVNSGANVVKADVTNLELNSLLSRGQLKGMPNAANQISTVPNSLNLDLRINIRGELPVGAKGNFADGIIGASAIEQGATLLSNDAKLVKAVNAVGGKAGAP